MRARRRRHCANVNGDATYLPKIIDNSALSWYKKNPMPWRRYIVSLVATFAFGFSLYNFAQSAVQVRSLAVQNAQIESRISALAAENHALGRRIKELREDPPATERLIRQELGLVRAGELVYRFR